MLARAAIPLSFLLMFGACTSVPIENQPVTSPAPVTTTPIRWRIKPDCLDGQPQAPRQSRESLSEACRDGRTRDFISVALSGGGTKAAVFSGEALFYLDFLGLLDRTSVISAVSGGSFAGALYALSCDPGTPCQTIHPQGRDRPLWNYPDVMQTLGQGYTAVIDEQKIRAFTPFIQSTVSAGRFADIIDERFLGRLTTSGAPFTFADLNPARPHLFLNATITSENRVGLEDEPNGPGCRGLKDRGFLRRRTPDEYFHFAFSNTYFGLLKSSVGAYPLAAGVAASSAFPALIDFAELKDHCATSQTDPTVLLMDGGANDNQALIEIYMVLSELVFRQHRSDIWLTNPKAIEALRPSDRAFLIVVNSSVTETTGADKTKRPFGIVGLLDAVISKTLAAVDVYSAEGYTLRKQSYLSQADLLRRIAPKAAPIYPSEIALTALDQYALGGTEAALRAKAKPSDPEDNDVAAEWAARRARRQSVAYNEIVENPEARRTLRLPAYHPQCYFEMRKALDASLISLDEQDQACLKEGARWAAVLRAQEMCDHVDPFVARPDGLRCGPDHVLPGPSRLGGLPELPVPSPCAERIAPLLKTLDPKSTDDPRVICRRL